MATLIIDFQTISWYIGILGVFIGTIGGIYFMLSLRTMDKSIKESMFFIFFASSIWTLYSILMIFYALMKLEITNILWTIIPILYAITALSFIIGTSKLMKFFKITERYEWKKVRARK